MWNVHQMSPSWLRASRPPTGKADGSLRWRCWVREGRQVSKSYRPGVARVMPCWMLVMPVDRIGAPLGGGRGSAGGLALTRALTPSGISSVFCSRPATSPTTSSPVAASAMMPSTLRQ